ncbi:hypothetical protein BaRGS_00022466 [Batillaria attramentaria]|uniref:Hexosyltransferase n=1 Tax=Batillaria attramentaria TaxID=370345 RepID=A0ABD0KGH3_9CAEN
MRFKPKHLVFLSGYVLCAIFVNLLCGYIRTNQKILASLQTSTQSVLNRRSPLRNNTSTLLRTAALKLTVNLKPKVVDSSALGTRQEHQQQGAAQSSTGARPKRCNGCFNSVFPMLIDEVDICETHHDQNIELVFLIVSSHRLRKRRDSIRQTWASITKNNTSRYRHVFLFGMTPDGALMERVREESRQFRDVLVSDFLDSYNNLTLKTLMGLRWAATRCRHVRFFMKVDDDVWVNTVALREMLAQKGELLDNRLIGMCRKGTKPERDPRSKWYVSVSYFPDETYPPFCGGPAYVGGMGVAARVVAVSKDIPFFFIEDVYLGFCLEALGAGVLLSGRFLTGPRISNDTCYARNSVIVAHRVYADMMRTYWAAKCDV